MPSTPFTTFALFFGNRGTFPAKLLAQARSEMSESLEAMGFGTLMLDANATALGAVESPNEGKIYAEFLRANQGNFQGIILCLPNFGSEGGVMAALKNAAVPVFVHAYPDELDRMASSTRRDAFCGKFAVLNILVQYGLKFTNLEPHAVHPKDPAFEKNIRHFSAVCRITEKFRDLTIGAIGARTTPFKAVRYDEIALQKHGIAVETLDLSEVFTRFDKTDPSDEPVQAKIRVLEAYANWGGVPDKAKVDICRLGVVLDQITDEFDLDALALRCWIELQQRLGISPCVLMGLLNDQGIASACEVDVSSAVAMAAIQAAAGTAATILDWNNNYGSDPDKCILFHCGPVPQSLMMGKGQIADHELLVPVLGKGCSWGCNIGRIKPMDVTYCGMKTVNGRIQFYLGEGRITEDPIPADFFGCAGVIQVKGLQGVLRTIGLQGHRHHTNLVEGHVADAVQEALETYLEFEVTRV